MSSQPIAQKRPRPRAINGKKQAKEGANVVPQPPSTRSTRSSSRTHPENSLAASQAQGIVQGGGQSPAARAQITPLLNPKAAAARAIKSTSEASTLVHKRKRPQSAADDTATQAAATKKGKKNPKPVPHEQSFTLSSWDAPHPQSPIIAPEPSSESEDDVPLQTSALATRQKARTAQGGAQPLSNSRRTAKKRTIIDDDPFQTVDEYSASSDNNSSLHEGSDEDGDNIDLSGEDDGLSNGEGGDEGLAGILEAEQPTWNETSHPSLAAARDKGKAKSTPTSKTPRNRPRHTSHPRLPVLPSRRLLLESSFDVSSGSEFEPDDKDDEEIVEDTEMAEEEQDAEWVKMVAERAVRNRNKAHPTVALTSRQQLEHPVWNDGGMPVSTTGPSSSAANLENHNDPAGNDDDMNEDPTNTVITAPPPQTGVPPLVAPTANLATVHLGPAAIPTPPAAPGIPDPVVAPVLAGVPQAPPVNAPNAVPLNAPIAIVPGPIQQANDILPNVLPPAVYVVVLNPTGGPPLLNRQHPHIRRAIKGSLPRLEVYLVTQNAFPDTVTASQFISLKMCEVAQQHGNTGLIQCINTDPDFVQSLVAIARQRASTFRLTVKRAADAHVVAQYGINPGNAVGKVVELFEWLKYIYPFTGDCADGRCTVPWDKPYLNDCVVAVLRAAFVNAGAHSMLNDHPEVFTSTLAHRPEETEIPAVMAGLVATAIHAAISEWRLGVHKSASFSADSYLDIYREHMIILNTAKEKNPRGYHTLMHRLYMLVMQQVMPTPAAGGNALAHVDFAGLGA